jgi:CMP/dCMP kinase
MTQIPVITIDGLSGSGKGTVGLLLAERLGWHFLDSGALYRVIAYVFKELNLENITDLIEFIQKSWKQFQFTQSKIFWLTRDITELIRTTQCGNLASQLALDSQIRNALLPCQRAFRQWPGLLADGRDMGTVVFPDAMLKIFLQASLKTRVERRHLQLKALGIHVSLEQLSDETIARDQRDQQRIIAPSKPAQDAVLIDTTERSVLEVVESIMIMWDRVIRDLGEAEEY